MKKLSKVLLIFLLSFLLAGCGTKGAEGDPRQSSIETVSDTAGYNVTVGSIEEEDRTEQLNGGTESAETANGTESEATAEPEKETETGDTSKEKEASDGEKTGDTANGTGASDGEETGDAANGTGASDETETKDATGEMEAASGSGAAQGTESGEEVSKLPEDGTYTSKEDVALYLHLYGHLPSNFITKKEAEKLGWTGGSLEKYAPGMCIGGNRFGNYEGLLPEKEGRVYMECDIDTLGAEKRGAKRIVFSNDGLVYYTEDHYQSFELLYGDE